MSKLLHVRLRVRSMEPSVSFYQDVLGFTEVNRSISPAGNQLVFMKLGDSETLLELCFSPNYTDFVIPEDLMHLAISVPCLATFREKWEPQGIVFWPLEGPVNDYFYFIDDPNGYEIEVMKER